MKMAMKRLGVLAVFLFACGDDAVSGTGGGGGAGNGGSGGGVDATHSSLFGDDAVQAVTAVGSAGSGLIVAAGLFEGSVDFGQGPLVASDGGSIFVAVRTTDGEPLWSRAYGSTSGFTPQPDFVASDASGNVYIAGRYWAALDLGLGALPESPDVLDESTFLLKLDAAGNPLWQQGFGWDYDWAVPSGLAVDGVGRAVLAYTVGDGCVTSPELDAFVRAFDPNGTEVYVNRWGVETACAGGGEQIDVYSGPVASRPDGRLLVSADGTLFELDLDSELLSPQAVDPAITSALLAATVAADGTVYLGYADDAYQVHVARLNADGTTAWSHEMPTSTDFYDLRLRATDAGVLISGAEYSPSGYGEQPGSNASYWKMLGLDGTESHGGSFTGSVRASGVAAGTAGRPFVGGAGFGTIDLGDGSKTTKGWDAFLVEIVP